MKKKLLILATLYSIQFTQAIDYRIVIRNEDSLQKGRTEISVTGGLQSDTITIVPGKNVEMLCFEARNTEGELVRQQIIPTNQNVVVDLSISTSDELLVIRDDSGDIFEP